MKQMALAILFGLVAVSAFAEGSSVSVGLNTLKKEVREELQWLESLEADRIEAFLDKHCPATLLVVNKLGTELAKAKAAEKEDIRQEIADVLEDAAYLHRELQHCQKEKKAKKVKVCLQIFVLQDQKVLAELDLARLERKKAKPAQTKAKEREIEELDRKIDKLYDTLDAEAEEK